MSVEKKKSLSVRSNALVNVRVLVVCIGRQKMELDASSVKNVQTQV